MASTPLFSKGMLEGNYNSYAYHGTITVPNGVPFPTRIIMHIDEIRDILYIFHTDNAGDWRYSTWNLNTLVNIFTSPLAANYWNYVGSMTGHVDYLAPYSTCMNLRCSRNRYVYLMRVDTTTLEIWKDGALLQTINMLVYDVLFGNDGLQVCPSGEWLISHSRGTLYIFRGTP